jgi:hypothetical protein
MRRIFLIGMCAFTAATVTSSCKRQSVDELNLQASAVKKTEDQSQSRQDTLGIGNYIFKFSGLKQEDIENLRELVTSNFDLFQNIVQEGTRQMSSFPKADAEGRVKILTTVFKSFVDAFLPLGAKVFSPQNPEALIKKVQPQIDSFLADIETVVRQKVKSPVLSRNERSGLQLVDLQNLSSALKLDVSKEDVAMTFGHEENVSALALNGRTLESSSGNGFGTDFGKAVPNTSVLAGLFLGIMSTLVSYCVIVFGGLAVSAAAPAITVGAVVGIGWVCLVGLWRTFLIASGQL